MGAANKVVLNTFISYGRMMLTMGISLYSTRLVLNALGDIDYGIFNLVAGVIAMLSFLNVAMTSSTQRYMSFYQGHGDKSIQRKIFTNSLLLHIVIGLVIVLSLEIGGGFLFDGFLKIPDNRLESAKTIFHLMSATVFLTVLSVPFTALLNAHENMIVIAMINIIEAIMKLSIALYVSFITSDELVVFGLLTASISIVTFTLYSFYCLRKYVECTFNGILDIDKKLIKELTSFAGWNLFGTLCGLGRIQGLALLLNFFFGATINSAYGIANQVSSQLTFFSLTMLQAVNPQIMKSEGASDRPRMLRLSMIASKFGFFLLAFIAIPFIFEMPQILTIWLKHVPDNTVIFCDLILVGTLTNQLTIGVQSGLQATGKIKLYQSVVGSTILLNLPLSYVVLRLGFPAYSVLVCFIFIESCACVLRLVFLKNIAGLSILEYCKKVFLREIIPVMVVIFVCYLCTTFINIPFRFLLTIPVAASCFVICIFFTGLSYDEKSLALSYWKKVLERFGK